MTELDFSFFKVADTPDAFDIEKFKSGDIEQAKLYKDSKTVYHKTPVKYEDIIKEDSPNFAREVPKKCTFMDFDNLAEAEEMKKIIDHSGLRCLELKTQHGYQFLFRKPDFYQKELTGATNWFGYKFDCKGWTKGKSPPVQIIKVCGMLRKEVASWNLDTPITTLDKIDIEELDVLPYWLYGKLKDNELHKEGKTGDRTKDDAVEYTLTDNPFTQLMTMKEGGRHSHIVERCSYFALSNGFEIDEFKSLITAIHDQYLVKLGTPMPDSDLFGDLEDRWDGYKATLESSGWTYEEKERKWKKVKEKKSDKIDERRAAEYLFDIVKYFVTGKNSDGTYNNLLHTNKDGSYDYKNDFPELKQKLREYSNQNFKETFYKEVREQLMQMCIEHNKIITRNNKYIFAKNKILSCISSDAFDFSWLGKKPPTDVVLPWNWYSKEWVEEHAEDLGGLITHFIEDLSRDSFGKPQPIIQDWLWVIAGASMIPANQLQKIIVLGGGGANGKSIFTSLIRLCLGEYMFNESKIFSSNPNNGKFWGEDLDKGILCVVDDMPRLYNREAFTAIKGAVTGSDTGLYINEKFKSKKRLDSLPQIIACTNFEFELYDKSEGMKRRLCIIPTEFEIPPEERDFDFQHKLVLNTMDKKKIAEYKMSDEAFNYHGKKVMNMYTGENGVLDSLASGSLAWFANKARYMYMDWISGKIKLEYTERMECLLLQTFDDTPKGQIEDFINWLLVKKCGSTDNTVADLSPANGFYYELYLIYKEEFCKFKKLTPMKESIFNTNCGRIVRKSFTVKKKKNNKGISYPYIYFDKPAKPFKKK